jgi:chemotaxis protein methyltransferase CheR
MKRRRWQPRSLEAPMGCIERFGMLELVARRVEAETGLRFSAARRSNLDLGLERMAHARTASDTAALAGWLLAEPWDQEKTDLCARHLTVGETYFFREPRGLDLLCDYARSRLAAERQARLRLWSAGCCTGEEPYSMAIALRQALPELGPGQVSILGTDLNPANLAHARTGMYREWSFRGIDPALRSRYFKPACDGRHALDPTIRDQVRFAQLNLALPVYPATTNGTAGLDIIFCRNVLMYFSRALMAQVIARLRACLVDGGWLVVNPSEASAELFAGFTATYYPDAVFYCKKSAVDTSRALPAAPLRDAGGMLVPHPPSRATPGTAPVLAARCSSPAKCAEPAQGASAPTRALARAHAQARAGEPGAALHGLARAAAHSPMAAQLHQAAAQLALDQGATEAAQRHLRRLFYLEPDSIIGHYLDGVIRAQMGQHARAHQAFAAADALLAVLTPDTPVPGADGWQAGGLRACVDAWLERTS